MEISEELCQDLIMALQVILVKLHNNDPLFIKQVTSLLKQLDKDTDERN